MLVEKQPRKKYFKLHCKKNCCSFIGLTTLIVEMTINISLRQAKEKIDNS